MNYTYLYFKLMSRFTFWLTIAYFAYIFYSNGSLYQLSLAAIGFILFMYMTLDCDMEAEKARMREETGMSDLIILLILITYVIFGFICNTWILGLEN